jgi:hypothetical protein
VGTAAWPSSAQIRGIWLGGAVADRADQLGDHLADTGAYRVPDDLVEAPQ